MKTDPDITKKVIELETKIAPPPEEIINEEVPKKRGRKPGTKLNKEPIKQDTVEVAGLEITSTIFDIVVKRLPNPEPITIEEKEILNKLGDKVLNKYINVSSFKYGEEVLLSFACLMVLYPRLKKEGSKNEISTENRTDSEGRKLHSKK